MTGAPPLSVRIGIAPNPFGSEHMAGPGFWATIRLMEELGYDSIWLSDTAGLGGLAPIPALAAIAARTERLKLGTSVLVLPPRNPVLLARELATIDVISGGRLLPAGGLGIGLPAELEAMGVAGQERVGRLEESVGLIKALWSGEAVTCSGRFWSVTDLQLTPRPTRRRLEFWLGGRAPGALRRIGRIADGWLASFVGPDEFAGMVDVIRASAAEAGRSIDADHYGATIFATPARASCPRAWSSDWPSEAAWPAAITWRSARPSCVRWCAGFGTPGVEVRCRPDRGGLQRLAAKTVCRSGRADRVGQLAV